MREYLKALRTNAGMTMQDVAERFGITRQYYEMIENGDRQRKLNITLIIKISELFGVSVEQVVAYEGKLLASIDTGKEA